MHLIATHDNADFDAVASQLAAHKLLPGSLAVLPHRSNRNVRHFTRLYWDELPYMHARDLPKAPVTQITVVDTQTVQSFRGMSDDTAVRVIDHHTRADATPEEWQVTIEPTGATTTILVEQLRDQHHPLTPIEATLLLLGIYEDTGSLTYGATTARDAYAAAWLLSQGALLDVAGEFLDHPLSDDQAAVFEQLQESAQTLDIEGHPVVIATASAPDMVEEIATLAHKLRDLLDPDAVFLLVELGRHIQLVARSTVDAIDVGRIAEQMNGGGHGRAAAGIVRESTLEQAAEHLLALLRASVQPSLTVADLMSHGVRTLGPDVRADEADRQMRRYGYEGFPIVESDRVIGLLTRRAVDRALHHGLTGVRAQQIMEAGSITVSPDDSIATLQQRMMDSGWGQIPVIDEHGRIAGVVTRTDLIKTMGHDGPGAARRTEIVRKLEAALPAPLMALVRAIGDTAEQMDLNLYAVGGFVRDLLLGQPNTDIDFVVEGDAIRLARALKRIYGGDTRSHRRFGTGKWLLDADAWAGIAETLGQPLDGVEHLPPHLDFATARTEFYEAPTMLPEVERSSIKHDIHRRDFTINTLAVRLDPPHFGQLLDFYGGEEDLNDRVIRVLHSLSFVDDPTRILRAVRFEQRLGFDIEPRTAELIDGAITMVDRVSGDRLKHELELILHEEEPERALCRLARLGVLSRLHPDLRCDDWLHAAYRALRYAVSRRLWPELGADFDTDLPYFALLLYRLPVEGVHHVAQRLHVRRRTVDTLVQAAHLRAEKAQLSEALPPSRLDALLGRASDPVLATVWAAAPNATARDQIEHYARTLRYVAPSSTGDDLRSAGLKPGPAYARILKRLRQARLDAEVTTDSAEAALLAELLAAERQEEPS